MKISISQEAAPANTVHDIDLVEAIVVRLYEQLHARAFLLTQCRHEADDLVQRVVERALNHPGAFGPGHRPWAWLTRVMRNLFIDDCRMKRIRKTTVVDPELVAEPVSDDRPPAYDFLTTDDLQEAMARLPEKQQALVQLAHLSGRSYRELSAELGISSSTIGTRLLRARRRLKGFLEEICSRKLQQLEI